ncbi:hypothetical protein PULV_b0661 [Pseudoalteromonas ulvae UL12]|uniref:hypothetical protein n=1 Tax=Pseudoalteromonas ulvae TaxID=107327 RepID=UPI00159351B9|nr:hypothetical protein [Pseudoalteromonas ulvae]MBE0365947.1 hypothetical protein [Pseudoalteromonas ulvae UL12]
MTTTPICEFGLHKGQHYSQLPVSFLNWMIANQHKHATLAKNELTRRHQVLKTNNACIE